jgi:hypothetical protein
MGETEYKQPVLDYAATEKAASPVKPLNAGQRTGIGCLASIALAFFFAFSADHLPWQLEELPAFPMVLVAWALRGTRRGTVDFSQVLLANGIFWGFLIAFAMRRRRTPRR